MAGKGGHGRMPGGQNAQSPGRQPVSHGGHGSSSLFFFFNLKQFLKSFIETVTILLLFFVFHIFIGV